MGCCDDIATEYEEEDMTTIKFPSCGAVIDRLCIYDTEAFCMECGEVFGIDRNIITNNKNK